jgi:hypothetical protein
MKRAMLGLDSCSPCRRVTFISLDRCQGHLGRQLPNYNLSILVAQQQYPLVTFLVIFHYPSISSPSLCMAMGSSSLAGVSLHRAPA